MTLRIGRRALLVAGSVLALRVQPARAAEPASQTMSVEECVAAALRQNPDVLVKNAELAQAEAVTGGAEGRLGPRLHVDANAQQWNGPFNIPFGGSNFTVRTSFTWLASASLIQPITGLWPIYENYKLQGLGVDVAKVRREATRRDVAYQVTEAYMRTLESARLSEVAAASVEQLSSQLKEAQSLYQNGVVSQTDVLRAQVAVANAKQRVVQLRGQELIAHARLAGAMGLPAGTPIEPRPLTQEPPPRLAMAIDEAERRALVGRVELREIDAQIAQADKAVQGAQSRLVPDINLIGNYSHNGGSEFVQENALYVGATASWDVWDWGATINGIHEADAHTAQIRAAKTKVDEMVRLEVRQAYVDVETTADGIEAAKTAVASAEENYRLVTKRYEAASATAFDVIDAEGLLTQARGQMQTSLYDYWIACAALDRALGIAPHAKRSAD
jgi:outer membrane protein TolC